MQLQCPLCSVGSTLLHQQEELINACLTEMQDTDGLPFIYMQNQVHLILLRCPQQSKHYSETTLFSLLKVYLGIF